MLTVQAECGLVTTNGREVTSKLMQKILPSILQVLSFGCPGAHLLKVTVIIGPKMLFLKYQWL